MCVQVTKTANRFEMRSLLEKILLKQDRWCLTFVGLYITYIYIYIYNICILILIFTLRDINLLVPYIYSRINYSKCGLKVFFIFVIDHLSTKVKIYADIEVNFFWWKSKSWEQLCLWMSLPNCPIITFVKFWSSFIKKTAKTSDCKIVLYQRPVTDIRGAIVQASFTLQNLHLIFILI